MDKTILIYIKEQLLNNDIEDDFDADDDLLGSGILDSLGMVQLIAFVEKEFKIAVLPEEMIIENFMTVNHIVNYAKSK
ncbi:MULTISPECIES: acyl carrier protein [Hwangdonia]|uniref:Acyl carrier protein n=1 Tax=Hwangdonia seohaensis TaxID=1240727 RepID=A0ABW3RAQ3_9FLAO|nr:acyl carrier protein [Hwangdonia seohaensis]